MLSYKTFLIVLFGLATCCHCSTLTSSPTPLPSRRLVEDRSISEADAEKIGVAGGECFPSKTECPFSTTCILATYEEGGTEYTRHLCVHKGLFPLNGSDAATVFLLLISVALAAGGGIGGGGLLVPIYRLVCGFPITQATALSLATISGGSIANLYTYTQRYHPNSDLKRPLIDYETSLLFCPALLAGTMFGSMFSVMFPAWLIVVLLVILLGYSGKRTVNKGIQRWKLSSQSDWVAREKKEAEVELSERNSLSRMSIDSEASPLHLSLDEDDEMDPPALTLPSIALSMEQSVRLDTIRAQEGSLIQARNWGWTAVLWVVVFIFALLRGGKGGTSLIPGLTCEKPLYWGLFAINLFVLLTATAVLRSQTLSRAEEKTALGHKPLEGDLHWDRRTTALYPALCVFAGVAAGLLGIGGGMVIGPLLVELGCLPQPIAATSAYVVFITATSGLAQVYIMGLVPGDYAIVFSCCGVLATFLGQSVVDYVVKKYKKDAIVVLVIGFIMMVALVLMTYDGVMQIIYATSFGFTRLC
mmetsp:Transcript_19922/g.37153  ORF Transcript_19922/g.37153 Transcript_19922/m.37153 type:complete len:530 (-) Transcript_19922:50-1639(-)